MNILLILVLIPLVKAQVGILGICPKVEPVQNFQKNDYTGRWYTIIKYTSMFDRIYKCDNGEYSFTEDGKLLQLYKLTRISDNVIVDLKVVGTFIKDCNTPELDLEIWEPTGNVHIPTTVIATDYVNYNVFWGCQQFGNYTLRYSWVFSRKQTLSPAHLYEVLKVYKKYGIDIYSLDNIEQCDCPN